MTNAPPRPKKSYSKGIERRREIIDAATELVMENGSASLSMRELARRAGLSQSGLLHYFPDSTAVLTAVIEEKEELLAARASELAGEPAEQMLAVETYDAEHAGIAAMFTILAAEGIMVDHPLHDYFVRRYERVVFETDRGLTRLQAGEQMRGDVAPSDVATLLVAVLDGMRLLRQYVPETDTSAAIRAFWRLLGSAEVDRKAADE